ncbi:unnamed protein product, partial [Prorocentrum cordatum]
AAVAAGELIEDRLLDQVLPSAEGGARLKLRGLRRPCPDPAMRGITVHMVFLKRLHAATLLDFRRRVRRRTSCFSAWEKSGAQRLAIDARIPSIFFEDPDPAQLASGACFANLQLGVGPPLTSGGADIKLAFYAISMPAQLRDLFGFDKIRAWELSVTEVDGRPPSAWGLYFHPVIAAPPMGWALALQARQALREELALREPDDSLENAFVDGRPPQVSRPSPARSTSTTSCFGRDRSVVDVVTRVRGRLVAAGLPIHGVEVSQGGDGLGWHLTEQGCCSMSLRSAWWLRMAFCTWPAWGGLAGERRHLILGDAMTVIRSRAKGRGGSLGLCRALRRSAAPVLAANLHPAWHWVPSERGAADAASRAARPRAAPAARAPLARRSVSARQESQYCDQNQRFLAWTREQGLRHQRIADLEVVVVEMFNQMYYGGWRPNAASKMVVAIADHRPVAGPGCVNLARVLVARWGFAKLRPPRARLPPPWAAACLVAKRLVDVESWRKGAAVVFTITHYWRPREVLRIRERDLVPPAGGRRRSALKWSVTLRPQELAISSKTGARDESIVVDNAEAFPLIEALMRRLCGSGGKALAFPFRHREWAANFESAAKAVGLQGEATPVLYML